MLETCGQKRAVTTSDYFANARQSSAERSIVFRVFVPLIRVVGHGGLIGIGRGGAVLLTGTCAILAVVTLRAACAVAL